VESSTKLLEEIGDEAYDAALAEHRRVVREACPEHAGVDVYLSSTDLPEGEQLIFTYKLCAALQEGERCHLQTMQP
jgi:hypothetical protein